MNQYIAKFTMGGGKLAVTAIFSIAAAIAANAGDSVWGGGDGNWSDENWTTDGENGAFVSGNRAVIGEACTITVDADTEAVGGICFTADATIAGTAKLVMAEASKAQTIEVEAGVSAKISAPIDGRVRKTGYGSLETTADKYNTLTLDARNVTPTGVEIDTGSWIVSGGSTVHSQTPSTEGETGWYYFQGENNSYSDPEKGAYITVKDGSTLMYSRGSGAPWTCFGPRNKNGHFELLITGGSTFRTQSDDFRISSEQGSAANTYFKMRVEDSTAEIRSTLNGNSRNSNATKILEFVNSDVTFNVIQMKGPASRNSVTFDGATVHTRSAQSTFFNASERSGTVLYHSVGNGLTIDAAHDVTLSAEAAIDGEGGLTKTGARKLTILAANEYTGTTRVSAGELALSQTGAVAGPVVVDSGATLTVTSSAQGEVPSVTVDGTMTLSSVPLVTDSLTLGAGATLNLGTYGNAIKSVSGYEGANIVFDASGWPLDAALFSSDDEGFLAAMVEKIESQVSSGLGVEVVEGAIYVRTQTVAKEAVWTGLGADANWSTAGNWDAAGTPNTGDWLKFTGSSNAANVNDLGSLLAQSVVFDAGSGPFEIGGEGGLAAPAWTNLSENAQTLNVPATATASETAVHAAGDLSFAGGLSGSSAYAVVKDGAGRMTVAGTSWGGKLRVEEGGVAFTGITGAPVSQEANEVVVKNGSLDIGGQSLNLVQNPEAEPILQDGATLLNGTYSYSGVSGYNGVWAPGTVTVGEGATLVMNSQLIDNPKTAGKRTIRVVDGGVFSNGTDSERHLASGNTEDTAFVLDIDGGKALFGGWGYIYFGSRQGSRRRNETYVRNGGYLSLNTECRLGDYDGTGGSNVFVMEDSAMWCRTFNVGVRTDSLTMVFRNSSVTNDNVCIGNGLGADPAKHSVTFDNATLVSNTAKSDWLAAANNTETAVVHLGEGGVTMQTRHDVGVKAVMDGEGGLVKTGGGTLTISAKQLYTGTTRVAEGTLALPPGIAMAGALSVESGATLSLSAAGGDVPSVASLSVAEGGILSPSGSAVSEDLEYVAVLNARDGISLPRQSKDADGNRFFVRHGAECDILCYGRTSGMQIIVR